MIKLRTSPSVVVAMKALAPWMRAGFYLATAMLFSSCTSDLTSLMALGSNAASINRAGAIVGALVSPERLAQHRRQRQNELEEMRRSPFRQHSFDTMTKSPIWSGTRPQGAIIGSMAGQMHEQGKLQQGIRCPGNMVISPYRPQARPVPIKLLPPPPENVMICPYTEKKFIVPAKVHPVPPNEGGESRGPMESKPGIRPTSQPNAKALEKEKWTLFGQIRLWMEKDSQAEPDPNDTAREF